MDYFSKTYIEYINKYYNNIDTIIAVGYFPYYVLRSLLSFEKRIIHINDHKYYKKIVHDKYTHIVTKNYSAFIVELIDNTKREYVIISWNFLDESFLRDICNIYGQKYGIVRTNDATYNFIEDGEIRCYLWFKQKIEHY